MPVVLLDPDLPLPAYAREGDAGLDLLAREDAVVAPGGGRALVPTGVALAIPEGFAGFVLPRSGLAMRHGLTVVNAPGLIDAGYRDEVKVLLLNTDPEHEHRVLRGERIAQLVIQRVETALLVEVEMLPGEQPGWRVRPHRLLSRRLAEPRRRGRSGLPDDVAGSLSSRSSRKLAWRTRPSLVHSAKAISATSTGCTQVASRA